MTQGMVQWRRRALWVGLAASLSGCDVGGSTSSTGTCASGSGACEDAEATGASAGEPPVLTDAESPAVEGTDDETGETSAPDTLPSEDEERPAVDEGDAFEEPPLPPPLSMYFAIQQGRLTSRRTACELPVAPPLPAGLVEHLTTRLEYEAHQDCVADIEAASCSSSLVQAGDLGLSPRCLYGEPTLYDAVNPPATCPFSVEEFTFSPEREQFSLHNAYWLLWMATACNLAEPALISAEFAARGFPDVRVVQAERLTVAILERDDSLVFVFKGSTETSDYLSNAAYVMKSTDETGLPGRVHSGFYDTLASGFAALEPELTAARDLGKKVFFAGHSLGGACAQMAALKAKSLGVDVAQLYAFSSPRVGDAAFGAALELLLGERLYRINNGLDITPHVPPSAAAEDPAREAIVEVLGDAEDPGFWLGSLSVTLQAGLLLADYTHAGDAYSFDERGYLQALRPYTDEDEIPYWQQLPNVVGEDNLLDVSSGFGQLPAYHDDGTHLCYQARAIDQLLYRRP